MNQRLAVVLSFGFVCGSLLPSLSCTEDNPGHCGNNGGDSYCKTAHGDGVMPYCSDNTCGTPSADGCQVDVPTGCWICDGQNGDNSDCDDVAGDGDGEPGDGDGEPTGDGDGEPTGDGDGDGDGDLPPECSSSDECDADTPLCDDGDCVACGDAVNASCSAEYPAMPVCDGGSGMCFECTAEESGLCTGNKPACEGGVCVACDEHAQCPLSACNMSTGACMPEDRVWWVDQAVAVSGNGTMGSPLKTIAEALMLIENGGSGTIIVATALAHIEKIDVLAGRTVALLGDQDGASLQFADAPVVSLNGNLFASRLRVSQGTAGVSCSGGALWFDSGRIFGNTGMNAGRGVVLDSCEAMFSRSEIVGNSGGAIRATNASHVAVVNSFLGGDVSSQVVLTLQSSTADVVYTTLVAGYGTAQVAACDNGGTGSTVRNSILVSGSASPTLAGCANMTVVGSALDFALGDNVNLGEMMENWFANYGEGDLHLTAQSPASLNGAATWANGDPSIDIDGDLRPNMDGTPDYAGADVRQ